MKPGRAPKPTALKLVQGNPGRRPVESKGEARLAFVAPHRPAHLSPEAAAEWDRILPMLLKYQLVSEIDSASLALYCQSYGRWVEAEGKLAEVRQRGGDGLLMKAPSGYPIQNPYLAIANRAMEDCHRYLQQFGLSPSARTRVVPSGQLDLFRDGEAEGSHHYF